MANFKQASVEPRTWAAACHQDTPLTTGCKTLQPLEWVPPKGGEEPGQSGVMPAQAPAHTTAGVNPELLGARAQALVLLLAGSAIGGFIAAVVQ